MRRGIAWGLLLLPALARGYTVGSALTAPCHERLSGAALRQVRGELATAPPIAPSDNERAMIDDLPFAVDADLRDLGGAALLLAVRDNDLKGIDPTDTYQLLPLSAEPSLQREHCLRAPGDDEPNGSAAALEACRAFIATRAAEALDGLDGSGAVDAARRVHLSVDLATRGPNTDVTLPLYYVRIGQAMHALEDGFAHNFRTADGLRVTSVFNWSEYAGKTLDESRDGPAHARLLDACDDADAPRTRRHQLAVDAAAGLLRATLDPSLARDDKRARVDALTAQALALAPDCHAPDWCDPPEQSLRDGLGCGCHVGGQPRTPPLALLLIIAVLLLARRLRVLVLLLFVSAAGAQELEPAPTAAHLEKVRETKQPGSRVGFHVAVSGAFDRPALAATLGLRVRLSRRWLVGVDGEWNPWLSNGARAGTFDLAATGILRHPLTWERVNLRHTLSFGTSVLLFDVYGAPAGSVGLYFATSPLGVDFDFGHHVKLVIDPVTIALPVPHLTAVPFYYLQYRFTVGFQFGA